MGKGAFTAIEVKEVEAPPNGAMTEDVPPKGVRAEVWLLFCAFAEGE